MVCSIPPPSESHFYRRCQPVAMRTNFDRHTSFTSGSHQGACYYPHRYNFIPWTVSQMCQNGLRLTLITHIFCFSSCYVISLRRSEISVCRTSMDDGPLDSQDMVARGKPEPENHVSEDERIKALYD